MPTDKQSHTHCNIPREAAMAKPVSERKHFVLIHGACHGAWCWYKVTTQLKLAGHQVTALDMAASGMDAGSVQDVRTVADYSQPLLKFMEKLPENEHVVLVGHSLGGINIAVAMEKFPEKISVAVFLTACMPDTVNPRSHVIQELHGRISPDAWLDTRFTTEPPAIISFGPEFMKQKLYQNSPPEDLELAVMLTRPGPLFMDDPTSDNKFTAEAYGLVKRVFVVCGEDLTLLPEYQHWMIENYGGITEVMDIPKADHMPMLSKPDEVVKCLLEAAGKLA